MEAVQKSRSRRLGFAVAVMGAVVLLLLLFALPHQAAPVSDVKSDERLVLLPAHAAYDAKAKVWRVHLHGWVFEPRGRSISRRTLKAGFRKAAGVPDDAASRKRFEERIAPFLYDNERGKTVVVRIGNRIVTLGKTDRDGHVEKVMTMGDKELSGIRTTADRALIVRAVLHKDDSREFAGTVRPISASGLTVVSDIDDTIKVSQVTNRKELLANTFYRPFQAVAGMAALYQKLQKRGAVFHYVSASPWQLHGPLEAFRKSQQFPAGVLHLRRFRIVDVKSLSKAASSARKRKTIESLLREFPGRRFLLVGDSGERDPEIYGEIARKFSKQIAGIFIRNVTKELATDSRFRKAFQNVSKSRWQVFGSPREIDLATVNLSARE